jgi:hypothetical protein
VLVILCSFSYLLGKDCQVGFLPTFQAHIGGYSYVAGGPKAVESINFTLAYQKALTKKKHCDKIRRGKT